MDIVFGTLVFVFLAYAFAEMIYFSPKREEKKEALIFDNRVLAVIDGLYLSDSGINFRCTEKQMRSYASLLLEKAHALPGTKTLLSHTIAYLDHPNVIGRTFHSRIGTHGQHIVFALLCIIEYGKDHDNLELIKQCEQLLLTAHTMGATYNSIW